MDLPGQHLKALKRVKDEKTAHFLPLPKSIVWEMAKKQKKEIQKEQAKNRKQVFSEKAAQHFWWCKELYKRRCSSCRSVYAVLSDGGGEGGPQRQQRPDVHDSTRPQLARPKTGTKSLSLILSQRRRPSVVVVFTLLLAMDLFQSFSVVLFFFSVAWVLPAMVPIRED